MSLDVGALVGSVVLETTSFDRTYTRVVQRMRTLGVEAGKAGDGAAALDDGLASVAASGTKAAAGVDRAAKAAATAAGAEDKAAAAAAAHADALAEVTAVMTRAAAASPRLQQAMLRETAAQERLTEIQESGVASTRQLASAQAGLIGATRSVAAAQDMSAAASSKWRTSLMSGVKMAGELGLLIGGIEIAKKAIEFVTAGKDLTDSLNQVQAASRATNSQMVGVRAEAIGLGNDLKVPGATAVDAADAILDLVKAGVSLDRAMAAARPALLLAAAAHVKTADAARMLGDVLDEFQLPATQATKVANALAAGANAAGGGLQGMFDAFTYVGTRARAVGLGVDDIAAAVVDLAKAGLTGDRAGTGLAMMLQKLSHESAGGQQALQDLGVTAFNAQGKFVGLPKVIDELHAAQKRLNPQQFLSDINVAFGARAANVVAAFASKGSASYLHFLQIIKSGDVQKFADLANRGAAAGFRELDKEATAAGISLYQKFEPALSTAVQWLGTNLPGAVRAGASALGPLAGMVGGTLAAGWHLFAGAVGIAAGVLGPVLSLLNDFKGPLSDLAFGALAVWAGFKVFTAIPGMLTSVGVAAKGAALNVLDFGAAGVASAREYVGANTLIADSAEATAGTVAAAGEEASLGWRGILGPIGAVAAGIAVVVSMFHHSAAASHEAADAAKAYSDAFASGGGRATFIDTITGQLTKANVPNMLAGIQLGAKYTSQALDIAALSGGKFVTAIADGGKPLSDLEGHLRNIITLGRKSGASILAASNADAASSLLKVIQTQITGITAAQAKEIAQFKALGTVAAPIQTIADKLNLSTTAVTSYAGMLGLAVTKSGDLVNSTKANIAGIQAVSAAYNNATQTGNDYLTAVQTFSTSAGTAADRAALIGATLKNNAGDALNFAAQMNAAASAVTQLTTDAKQNASQVGKNGISTASYLKSIVDLKAGTIDYSKAAASPLIADLQSVQTAAINAATATYQHNLRLEGGKKAADDAVAGYTGVEKSLQSQLVHLGLGSVAAKKLTDRYLGVPSKVKTLIESEGTDPVIQVLTHIGQLLAALVGVPWTPKVGADTSAAHARILTIQGEINAIKQGHVPGLDANTAAGRASIAALQAQIDRLEGKTVTVTVQEKIAAALKDMPTTGATAVGSMSGTNKSPGRAVGGTLPAGWASVGEQGAELVHTSASGTRVYSNAQSKSIVAATGMVAPGFASGTTHHVYDVGGTRYATALTALNAYNRDTGNLSLTVGKYVASLGKNTAAITSAEGQLAAAMRTAGATHAQLAKLAVDEAKLVKLSTARDAVEAKLTSLRSAAADETGTVRSTVLGGFDITAAGRTGGDYATGASITGDIQTQIAAARGLLGNEQILRQRGLGNAFLAQLAEKGPAGAATSVAALMKMSPTQLKALNADYSTLGSLGTQLGGVAATAKYGASIAATSKTLSGLNTQIERLGRSIAAHDTKVAVYVSIDGHQIRSAVRTVLTSEARNIRHTTGKS